jgi:DNA polymerase III epsilon subunit-like protein
MTDNSIIKFYADYFYKMGFNISFLSNKPTEYNFIFGPKKLKAPSYEWEIFYERRQSPEELNSYNWDEVLGIGLILGFNNLAAIDIDGCVDQDILYDILQFLDLPKDYEWVVKSGSTAGFHIIFKTVLPEIDEDNIRPKFSEYFTDYQPIDSSFGKKEVNAYYPRFPLTYENLKINENAFCKIEFKWKRHIIVPPSLHACGGKYKFINEIPTNPPEWIDFEKLHEFQHAVSGNAACDSMGEGYSVEMARNEFNGSNRALVLDIETNGLVLNNSKNNNETENWNETKNWPRLLQISWGVCLNYRHHYYNDFYLSEETKISHLYLVKREIRNIAINNFTLDPNASRIHGLNETFLLNMGEDLKEVLIELIHEINKCDFIVCHNVKFDIGVIMSEMERCGLSEFNIFKEKKFYCTMEQNVELCKIGNEPYKYPSLGELYKFCFKKPLIPVHNSIHDVLITIHCYNKSQELWFRRFEAYEKININNFIIPTPNYLIDRYFYYQ